MLLLANSGHPQQDVVLRPQSMSRDQPGAGSAIERFVSPGTIRAKKRWHSPDIDQFSNQLDKGLGDHRSGGEPRSSSGSANARGSTTSELRVELLKVTALADFTDSLNALETSAPITGAKKAKAM